VILQENLWNSSVPLIVCVSHERDNEEGSPAGYPAVRHHLWMRKLGHVHPRHDLVYIYHLQGPRFRTVPP
jgi:hypothetical protein